MAPSLPSTSSSRDKEKESDSSEHEQRVGSGSSGLTTSFSNRRFRTNRVAPNVPVLTSSATRNDNGIEALRYEETIADKPPIPVIKAPPRLPPTETHPALRRPRSGISAADTGRRDSGLATVTTLSSKPREDSFADSTLDLEREFGFEIDFDSNSVLRNTPSFAPELPMSANEGLKKSETRSSGFGSRWRKSGKKRGQKSPAAEDYSQALNNTPIPTDSLIDDETLNSIEFSKRGSMMLLGMKAVNGHARPNATRRLPSFSMLTSPTMKLLPEDVEKESQKVRSMYEQGSLIAWEDGRYSSLAQTMASLTSGPSLPDFLPPPGVPFDRPSSTLSVRNEHELAGGIEDWEDIEGEDVDRYGFIHAGRRASGAGPPEPQMQRTSTMMQMVSNEPRKKRIWVGTKTASYAASQGTSVKLAPSRKVSALSLASQNSHSSERSASDRMRSVSNRLPGNKNRRLIEEAGDMLTLPPGLADIAEDAEGGHAAIALKNKEIARGEKWRKMATIVKIGADGQGMKFQFDPKHPKIVERTWKGIPDRWRAAAWYSFLAASAAKRDDTVSDEELVAIFHRTHDQSSREDVQIDLDVPRTIGSHIMFRRRYKGGQRLLFRVLHAFSLYFPEPGYVQGMASLVATLLCYYDEEKAFIMLVRIWTLRGLAKLYGGEFECLLATLDELQEDWLAGRGIIKKLADVAVQPTSWGTRWYLTVFNHSIPFAAQLRVWDIFMLLGDIDPSIPATKARPHQGSLDVLHATSAAIMDATSDVLMGKSTEFDNIMKVLSQHIPIKDEDHLMKVVRAEYKLHREGKIWKNRRANIIAGAGVEEESLTATATVTATTA